MLLKLLLLTHEYMNEGWDYGVVTASLPTYYSYMIGDYKGIVTLDIWRC